MPRPIYKINGLGERALAAAEMLGTDALAGKCRDCAAAGPRRNAGSCMGSQFRVRNTDIEHSDSGA
jgi:hypothetical protein